MKYLTWEKYLILIARLVDLQAENRQLKFELARARGEAP